MITIESPYTQFYDLDGSPLDSGYIYIGEANEDPETNPIPLFWDRELTVPASQPLRTLNGMIARNGSPATVYAATDYSLMVRNARLSQVFYAAYSRGGDVFISDFMETLLDDPDAATARDTLEIPANFARRGANSDITSLSGLTTPLSLAQGGSGSATGPVLRGHIAGLALSTAGSSATVTTAAGEATDSTAAALMRLAAAIAKTTSAWAVGSGNGGLDTGSIANNTWYHFYLIRRPDTGVVDVLISLSATAPTLPANYTQFRRIGSGRTNGSAQWTSFIDLGGGHIQWLAPVADVSGAATTANRTLRTLSVPSGVRVLAKVGVGHQGAVSGSHFLLLTSPDQSDTTPSASAFTVVGSNQVSTAQYGGMAEVWTNTSAQIGSRSSTTDNHFINTFGWFDPRGRDA
jgi:hypothetical protein